ncbi:hypothetical protein [Nocardia sp. NPDC059228]|uniref:hypothetical protein n=1 Tax=Nocardia sp. NPDC059228 TaxID=3346777 RepID=UPI0036C027FC
MRDQVAADRLEIVGQHGRLQPKAVETGRFPVHHQIHQFARGSREDLGVGGQCFAVESVEPVQATGGGARLIVEHDEQFTEVRKRPVSGTAGLPGVTELKCSDLLRRCVLSGGLSV